MEFVPFIGGAINKKGWMMESPAHDHMSGGLLPWELGWWQIASVKCRDDLVGYRLATGLEEENQYLEITSSSSSILEAAQKPLQEREPDQSPSSPEASDFCAIAPSSIPQSDPFSSLTLALVSSRFRFPLLLLGPILGLVVLEEAGCLLTTVLLL